MRLADDLIHLTEGIQMHFQGRAQSDFLISSVTS
jgi:hypothetical protein